ncbi:RidA family protein [Mesorhizobium sp. SB112]|uniref:RidA family protein n=1 Tax=Mesorhizobium sp. SB112 TaxID=3151853 RepID=UPI0032678D93
MTTQPVHQILHPSEWKAAKGYANGVLAEGRMIFLGGQIGWTGDQVFEAKDLAGQTRQTLANIVEILREGGGGPEHIVKMTWYVTSKAEYLADLKGIGAAYRDIMGKHYPAMAMVQVVALMEDEAKVEIEATAVLPR